MIVNLKKDRVTFDSFTFKKTLMKRKQNTINYGKSSAYLKWCACNEYH